MMKLRDCEEFIRVDFIEIMVVPDSTLGCRVLLPRSHQGDVGMGLRRGDDTLRIPVRFPSK